MNVRDRIKRLHEVVISDIEPNDINVLWMKRNIDSTYTSYINDGINWITPKYSESEGMKLTEKQLEAILKAERIVLNGNGDLFLSDDGTYKSINKFLSKYAMLSDVPIKVSQLDNDAGFVTENDVLDKHYTKSEVDYKISEIGESELTRYYTKEAADLLLDKKAEKSSLSEYAKKSDFTETSNKLSEDVLKNSESIRSISDAVDILNSNEDTDGSVKSTVSQSINKTIAEGGYVSSEQADNIVLMTQNEYDSIEEHNPGTIYMIYEEE